MDFNPFSSYRFSARDEHERSKGRCCAPWATLSLPHSTRHSTASTASLYLATCPLPPFPHGFFFALLLRPEPGSRPRRVARTPGETRRLCAGENDRLRLAHSWKRLPKRISERRALNPEGGRGKRIFADSMTILSFVIWKYHHIDRIGNDSLFAIKGFFVDLLYFLHLYLLEKCL